MPRLKVRPETAQTEAETNAAEANGLESKGPESKGMESTPAPLRSASADMIAHQSPALALQTSLEQAWTTREAHDAAPVAKIPFGWTLIAMSVVCAAFWYVILKLAF